MRRFNVLSFTIMVRNTVLAPQHSLGADRMTAAPNPCQNTLLSPVSEMKPPVSESDSLDRGAPPPETGTPCQRCYLDGAAPPLPDQVEEIGVASHGLQESLTSAQRVGVLHAQFGVPWVQVARSPVSQLTKLWPWMSGIVHGLHCHKRS